VAANGTPAEAARCKLAGYSGAFSSPQRIASRRSMSMIAGCCS
jgi:hypothetical protein